MGKRRKKKIKTEERKEKSEIHPGQMRRKYHGFFIRGREKYSGGQEGGPGGHGHFRDSLGSLIHSTKRSTERKKRVRM